MTSTPPEPIAISHAHHAARDDVVERLRSVNDAYHRARNARRQLMVTASDLGLSVRQIADLTGEGRSSVATWIRATRALRD
ncbi:hypothetical protein ACNUCX_14545 [Curtobacterium flaccumfaciens pv. flaccumfaciens]|uniref:hypothetical protein n=1 Tax=Curtobacterium flaccumfaciens TaxID=2035 RepID=UPI003AB61DAE